MATPSVSGIFGLDMVKVFELVAFLIFVYLVAGNSGAFAELLSSGSAASVSTIKVLQGR